MDFPLAKADIIPLIKRSALLSELIDEDVAYFAFRTGCREIGAGSTLFTAGSKADRFWVVETGDLAVIRKGDIIARFGAGDVIGDFDFARGAIRDANARSEGGARLLVFPDEGLGLDDLVRERPDSSARLLLRSIAMISSRLRSVQRLITENDPWVRELRRQSWTDSATGLYTKTFLAEEVRKHLEAPTLFLLMKPDHFKDLCDAHGHSAGDIAMAAISQLLHDEVASLGRGWAIRVKSNETALVIPRCGLEEAVDIARRVAQGYDGIDISKAIGGAGFHFSVSQALAFWPDHDSDPSRLFDAIYGVLMRAWRDGGARVYQMRASAGKTPADGAIDGGPIAGGPTAVGSDRRRHVGSAPTGGPPLRGRETE